MSCGSRDKETLLKHIQGAACRRSRSAAFSLRRFGHSCDGFWAKGVGFSTPAAGRVLRKHLRLTAGHGDPPESSRLRTSLCQRSVRLPNFIGAVKAPIAKLIQHVSQGPDFVPHQPATRRSLERLAFSILQKLHCSDLKAFVSTGLILLDQLVAD